MRYFSTIMVCKSIFKGFPCKCGKLLLLKLNELVFSPFNYSSCFLTLYLDGPGAAPVSIVNNFQS